MLRLQTTLSPCSFLAIALGILHPAIAEESEALELDPFSVSANRIDPASFSQSLAFGEGRALDATDLSLSADLSDQLRSNASFATFRETPSYAAHPTTQGIRLRNFGANATSRTLVVHDGVPQNDPFGGWIYWHQYNLSQLEYLSLSAAGNGEVWGNFGSGGLISLVSRTPIRNAGVASLSLSSLGGYSANAYTTVALSNDVRIDIGGRRFETDGFYTLDESQRGSVDEKARSKSESLQSRISWVPTENWRIQLRADTFDEERGNGTTLSTNNTDALNLSLLAERLFDNANASLNFVAYGQDRDFRNVFAAVETDRNAERPALDQYDVPATASGFAVSYRNTLGDEEYLQAGIDFRKADAEVNERFRNLGAGFTRDRSAGGEQTFVGAFSSFAKQFGADDLISATLRIDSVSLDNGRRVETNLETDSINREDAYLDSRDEEISLNLRWRHDISDTWRAYSSVFTGFRTPTLNELYRPFRVRNDITESNPLLESERHFGIEFALADDQREHRQSRIGVFHYRVDDMIANALLSTESGFNALCGFVPGGGSCSQRVNLSQSAVYGFEASHRQAFSDAFGVDASVSVARTRIDENSDLPQFEGNSFPQSPEVRAQVRANWQPTNALSLWTRVSWHDEAFENLGNTTIIPSATLLSIGAAYDFAESTTIAIAIGNAFDSIRETGIANNGLISIGAPREARLSVTHAW